MIGWQEAGQGASSKRARADQLAAAGGAPRSWTTHTANAERAVDARSRAFLMTTRRGEE